MKNLITLLLACMVGFAATSVNAQPIPTRGTYGTIATVQTANFKCYTPQGTVKTVGRDTLTNGDTGYLWISPTNALDLAFDLKVTTLTGTIATSSHKLQGSLDGTGMSATWYDITGATAYCASCVGASSTTVPGASKHYVWQVPHGNVTFANYRVQTINTGTFTAVYTGTVTAAY